MVLIYIFTHSLYNIKSAALRLNATVTTQIIAKFSYMM